MSEIVDEGTRGDWYGWSELCVVFYHCSYMEYVVTRDLLLLAFHLMILSH